MFHESTTETRSHILAASKIEKEVQINRLPLRHFKLPLLIMVKSKLCVPLPCKKKLLKPHHANSSVSLILQMIV